jgi:hypothetical protein
LTLVLVDIAHILLRILLLHSGVDDRQVLPSKTSH